jgi:hypothetical protein
MVGMYGSNSALFTQLYTLFGYRVHGTLDHHALSTNKAGYGEPSEVVAINEHILAHNNSRWFDIQSIAQLNTWQISDDVNQQMRTYLDSISGNAIIEDARLSYTLSFWQAGITNAGHDITIVVPYQDPLIFAHRMHQQYHMSTRLALALWVAYTLAVETQSRTVRRVFVQRDAMLHDWQQACLPIIAQLAPAGLSATHVTHINAYMHMLQHTDPHAPHGSTAIRTLAIAQLASDVYAAIQQSTIDAELMMRLSQRLDIEIADPQYRHDVGQFAVVFDDVFLDTEARIRLLNVQHADAMHRQHSELSTKIRLLHEEHSKKMTELYEKHGKYIEHQSQMFAETLAKHEQQVSHMRTTFEQEIQHLNDKITTMQTEIDWRADVTQQQQQTLNRLGWAMRILGLIDRITRRSHTS